MVKNNNTFHLVACFACFIFVVLIPVAGFGRQSGDDDDVAALGVAVESQKQGEWITDFEAGLKQSQLRNLPVFVVLGAEWCGWCKKLEDDLDQEEASSIWADWVMVKIDVDREPEVASRLEASALPALRVLGIRGDVVGSSEGYVPLDKLEEWLDEQHESADPVLQQVLYGTTKPTKSQLQELVAFMAHRTPAVRSAAIERLAKFPKVSVNELIRIMRSGRLSERLSAMEVFERAGAPVAAYDAWSGETMSDTELNGLLEWSRNLTEANAERDEAIPPVPELPADIDDSVTRYLQVDDNAAIGQLANLSKFGTALLPIVEQRLSIANDLSPTIKQRLRLLAYILTASPKLRLGQPGLLSALARNEAATRQQAANGLFNEAQQIDLPLVEYLSRDVDPLIRELAVRKIASLGALNAENVKRLLDDSSLAVRTGVLAGLSENPSADMTKILCEYLQRETNEDLLVYGAKCLGEQKSGDELVMKTLQTLLLSESWRVRAATLDSTYNVIKPSGYGSSKPKVATGLSTVIIECVDDKDIFVSGRAFRLLPLIVTESNATAIAKILTNDPKHLESKSNSDIRGDNTWSSPPAELLAVGKNWLKSESIDDQTRAAFMLGALSPASLEPKLASLVSSNEPALRMIGYKSVLKLLELHRSKGIDTYADQWRISKVGREQTVRWNKRKDRVPFNEADSDSTQHSEDPVRARIPRDTEDKPEEISSKPKPSSSLMGILFGDTSEEQEVPNGSDKAEADGNASETPAAQDEAHEHAPDMFADIDDLFGGPPPTATEDSVPAVKKPAARKPDSTKGGSASQWLTQWQAKAKEVQPDWWSACNEAMVQRFATSNDEDELRWLELAYLAMGNTDRVDAIVSEIDKQINDPKYLSDASKRQRPGLSQLVAWLPLDRRAELAKALPRAIRENESQWGSLMREFCFYDNQAIASWLIDLESDNTSSKNTGLEVSRVKSLLNSLLGEGGNDLSEYLFDASAGYGRSGDEVPVNAAPAIAFLTERYASEQIPQSRAILLAAIAWIDRAIAVKISKGLLMEESVEPVLSPIAQRIVFDDLPIHANAAARELLKSKNVDVAQRALVQLSQPSSGSERDWSALVPVYYTMSWDDEFQFPVMPSDLQELEEQLIAIEKAGDPKSQVRARLLLLTLGRSFPASAMEPLKELLTEKQKFSHQLAAAYIAGSRVDEAAMASYEGVLEEGVVAELKEFYKALGKIAKSKQTPELKALRKRVMVKSTGK